MDIGYVYSRWTAHTDVQNAIVNAEGKYNSEAGANVVCNYR